MGSHEIFAQNTRQIIKNHDWKMQAIRMDWFNAVHLAVAKFRKEVAEAKIALADNITIREVYVKALQGDESCLKKRRKSTN